jgi:hypothetical protein
MIRATGKLYIAIVSSTLQLASVVVLGQEKPASRHMPSSKASMKHSEPGPMTTDQNGVRSWVSQKAAERYLSPNIAPASCDEWATQSTPIASVGTKCKVLGGKNLCSRVTGIHAGAYDIGPIDGVQHVGQPLTIHFRIRDFGSGDAVIYSFGKIDWGDNQQQDVLPFGFDIPVVHTYTSRKDFVIHAMGGAQFKYQGGDSTGSYSGSYEGCVDNSISVQITP